MRNLKSKEYIDKIFFRQPLLKHHRSKVISNYQEKRSEDFEKYTKKDLKSRLNFKA